MSRWTGGCAVDPIAIWPAMMGVSWTLLDTICFLLVTGNILKLWKKTDMATPLQRVLLRDGAYYFLAVMTINVVNIGFVASTSLPLYLRPVLALPTAVGVCECEVIAV